MLPESLATEIRQQPVGNEKHGWEKTHKLQVDAQTTSKMTGASVPTYFLRISKPFTAKERHHFSPSGYSEFNLERHHFFLEDERGCVFYPRNAAKEEFVRLSGEDFISCYAREFLVMHELLHAHLHLLLAVSDQLESSPLGDSVNFPYAAKDNAFEVAETSQGGSVDRQRPVRRGEGARLLLPREEVAMLAA